MRGALLLGAALVAAVAGCSKSKTPGSPSTPGSASGDAVSAAAASAQGQAGAPMDARQAAAWAAAAEGEPEELMRLADLVGCAGLEEGGAQAGLHLTAARAMQYCRDFSGLPWLAQVASDGPDEEARAALASIVELAARPRRAVDPEDADELHAGCASLLALAKAAERPKERRVGAIRGLRMLAEYGCVKRGEVPPELDAK